MLGTQPVSLRATTVEPVTSAGALGFFVGTTVGNTNGFHLYKTDGTAIGTTLTREIYAGTMALASTIPLFVTNDEAWLWVGVSSARAVLDGRAGSISRFSTSLSGPTAPLVVERWSGAHPSRSSRSLTAASSALAT